ncbi:hypothetical protein [Georgenia sp. AZ-5]|uniref:hypothetical protein n=1 Tax=Georgenia sp. AZ-5 TaxID=3367526 RepID=UPI0037545145
MSKISDQPLWDEITSEEITVLDGRIVVAVAVERSRSGRLSHIVLSAPGGAWLSADDAVNVARVLLRASERLEA